MDSSRYHYLFQRLFHLIEIPPPTSSEGPIPFPLLQAMADKLFLEAQSDFTKKTDDEKRELLQLLALASVKMGDFFFELQEKHSSLQANLQEFRTWRSQLEDQLRRTKHAALWQILGEYADQIEEAAGPLWERLFETFAARQKEDDDLSFLGKALIREKLDSLENIGKFDELFEIARELFMIAPSIDSALEA